jgi:hypothetical protein
MIGKRPQFGDETWQALEMLARDRMMNFRELAEEAFAGLLRKHKRPTAGRKDQLLVASRRISISHERRKRSAACRQRSSNEDW